MRGSKFLGHATDVGQNARSPFDQMGLYELAVRRKPSMKITDSSSMFDAITKSESPPLGLRSARSGEARATKGNISRSSVPLRSVHDLAMLANSQNKSGYPAGHVMGECLHRGSWTGTSEAMFQSGRKRERFGTGACGTQGTILPGAHGGSTVQRSLDNESLSVALRNVLRKRHMPTISREECNPC